MLFVLLFELNLITLAVCILFEARKTKRLQEKIRLRGAVEYQLEQDRRFVNKRSSKF